MSKPTLSELLLLKDGREEEEKRKKLAISLDICPECGSSIIEEENPLHIPCKSWFFGLFYTSGKGWYSRTICSKDENHYNNKYYIYY